MLRSDVPEGAIDYKLNPKLKGLSALQVYDEVIKELGRHCVAVIVNNHTTYGEFCGPPSKNSLWCDPGGNLSEAQWLEDWDLMARRYALCPHVIGYDLRNELRPRSIHWPVWKAARHADSEPTGRFNWARAARACALRVTASDPKALIIVERIVWPQRGLRGMVQDPGPLLPALKEKLVLGVHMYHWSGPGRFIPRWSVPPKWGCLMGIIRCLGIITKDNYGDMSKETLRSQIREDWGFALEEKRCPVWVSEFGADLSNEDEMKWLRIFTELLQELDADWAYWPLNVGPKPECGCDEAYGMLAKDWTRVSTDQDERLQLLKDNLGLVPPRGALRRPSPSPERLQTRKPLSDEDKRKLFLVRNPLSGMFAGSASDVWKLAQKPRPRRKLSDRLRESRPMSMPQDLSTFGAEPTPSSKLRAVQSAGGELQQYSFNKEDSWGDLQTGDVRVFQQSGIQEEDDPVP
jgi:hypothetical protein